jgi:hypothetical protein
VKKIVYGLLIIFFVHHLDAQPLFEHLQKLETKLSSLQSMLNPDYNNKKQFQRIMKQLEEFRHVLVDFEKDPDQSLLDAMFMLSQEIDLKIEEFSFQHIFIISRFINSIIKLMNKIDEKLKSQHDEELRADFEEYIVDYFQQISSLINKHLYKEYQFDLDLMDVKIALNNFESNPTKATFDAVFLAVKKLKEGFSDIFNDKKMLKIRLQEFNEIVKKANSIFQKPNKKIVDFARVWGLNDFKEKIKYLIFDSLLKMRTMIGE